MPTVGVVVPAYEPDVDRLRSFVRALQERLDPSIRVELDAPAPGLRERLLDLPATVNAVPERRGKGAAITAGFESLSTDVLAFADADGSTPADSVADVVAPVRAGEAGLAVGSRRHPDADVRSHQSFARRHLGDVFAAVARLLVDPQLYDYQCGAKAIDRETWTAVRDHLYEAGFAWDVELVAMTGALSVEVTEVPVTWIDRPESTVSPVSTAIELAVSLVRSRHRAKRLAGSRLHDAIATEEPTLVSRLSDPDPDCDD